MDVLYHLQLPSSMRFIGSAQFGQAVVHNLKEDITEMIFSPNSLDQNMSEIVAQFRQSKGPFVTHFLCAVPEHVFVISITRNANDEQAMYLHDALNTSADDVEYMRRYIYFLHNKFF